jgi:DNA-directed RNA polymerase specialized sigma subunit
MEWIRGGEIRSNFLWMRSDFFREYGRKFKHDKRGLPSRDIMRLSRRQYEDDQFKLSEVLQGPSQGIEEFEVGVQLRDPRLGEKYRTILILRFEWGLNLKEIGDVLGVTESRVSKLFKEALHLKRALE